MLDNVIGMLVDNEFFFVDRIDEDGIIYSHKIENDLLFKYEFDLYDTTHKIILFKGVKLCTNLE